MTNFFSLTDLGLSASSSQLLANYVTQMQTTIPGYAPSSANLEFIQASILASFASDLATLCGQGSTELFRVYATTLVGVPYQQGTSAQALITLNSLPAPETIATLSAPLSTAGPIVSIPVIQLQYGIAAGTITASDPTVVHTQTFTTSGVEAGATAIPITSATPNFNYPSGSTIGGTQVYVLSTLSQFSLDAFGFVNLSPTTLNSGASANVTLTAVQSGVIFNGAGQGGQVQSVQQLTWLDTITLVSPASGGQDPEDDAHYLDRVTTALQLQAPRPITATDFGTMALNFQPYPGTDQQEVGRATSIDGYNPTNGTFNNERMVTVAVTDANGFALNDDTLYGYPGGSPLNIITTIPTQNAGWGIAGWLQSLREINFIVNLISPTYSPIYVLVTVKSLPGWDAASVQQNVQSSLLSYLTPATWGLPRDNNYAWDNSATIFQSTLAASIQNTSGVDHIVSGTLAFDVTPFPSNTDDLTIAGPIALPVSSVATIPTSAITVV